MSDAIRAFVARVNARAEADMLNGRPVTGAHHRAIEAELAALPNEGAMSDDPRPHAPFTDCPRCHGTGECSNAQFRCICRWHRAGCAIVYGNGDCTCRSAAGPVPAPPERERFISDARTPEWKETAGNLSIRRRDVKGVGRVGNPPCQFCGGPHPFDTSLPSVIWNTVIRASGLPDYLCLTCICRAFAGQRESFTATLCPHRADCLYAEVTALLALPPAQETP